MSHDQIVRVERSELWHRNSQRLFAIGCQSLCTGAILWWIAWSTSDCSVTWEFQSWKTSAILLEGNHYTLLIRN